MTTDKPKGFRKLARTVKSWVVSFALAFAILAPLRSAIADWNDVPTGSMEPTILPGDRIFVNKLAYGLRVPFTHAWLATWDNPTPGEIVIFNSPMDGTRLVKRIVAVPGDTVQLVNNTLMINGAACAYTPLPASSLQSVPQQFQSGHIFATERLGSTSHAVGSIPSINTPMRNYGPVVVPAGQYLMLGDSRDNSADSRYFGFVKRELIVGRSSAVVFSLDRDRYFVPRLSRWFMGLH